ncbi:MAG: hypothetical protein JO065_13880 [Acidobacteria bacterium]|nr:hypothetical protein [Acidobacteriota bacterium]
MFKWLKRQPAQPQIELRDTLFGNIPFADWIRVPAETMALEPWATFGRAKQLIDSADPRGAIAVLEKVLKMPELESRHYLQAYYFLRELGVEAPPEKAKHVLGVVVEIGMEKGLDLIAGYADHRARYYNYSGAAVVWERPDGTLDGAVDELLAVGSVVAQTIGPWSERRPAAPSKGHARINILVASGLHFGQGPMDMLGKDRLSGPVVASAFRLMQELIKLSKK